MTKFPLPSVAVILSTAIAAPVFAQPVKQEPSAYALYLPKGALGVGSAPSQRQDVPTVSHGTADAMASTPSVRPWAAGNETATRPLSAPVGHHQPSAADAPTSTSASEQILNQEDANVDRIVRSVCRGCQHSTICASAALKRRTARPQALTSAYPRKRAIAIAVYSWTKALPKAFPGCHTDPQWHLSSKHDLRSGLNFSA